MEDGPFDPVVPDVRIPPAPQRALGPLGRAAARVGARATHGDPPRVLTTLARHRSLFRGWLPLGATLIRGSKLPRRDVELVILRTAWHSASWYEWTNHVALARAAGFDVAALVRTTEDPDPGTWSRRDHALLSATDELHRSQVISDPTWRLLSGMFSDEQLLELCFLVGHYEMLAMALNSLGVEPEPSTLARLPGGAVADAERLLRSLAARRSGPTAGAAGP
jgi:alkylhydroperoxidase family enzyme